MIIVDKPYVSDLLKNTIKENGIPVIKTGIADEPGFNDGQNLIEEASVIDMVKSSADTRIYITSENSIGWIARNLAFTNLPEKINIFKNKARFRTLTQQMYPDFFFREVRYDDLANLLVADIPMPCIIKPTVGFFSLATCRVSNREEWRKALESIRSDIVKAEGLYPEEVLNTSSFIIEQCIEGDEFAVDAYFDEDGEPVILNILQHIFKSGEDVSDRVYVSSKGIIESNIGQFTEFLVEIGRLAGVRNFPVHVEARRDSTGTILPIEINPMRFGGWCTTADMTCFAYGFNPYVYFFTQNRPDWDKILRGREGKLYSIIVLVNSTGIDGSRIKAFDYDRLLSYFEKPLNLRKIDYKEYPVFGFLFAETREENFSELDRILRSDLKEFIKL